MKLNRKGVDLLLVKVDEADEGAEYDVAGSCSTTGEEGRDAGRSVAMVSLRLMQNPGVRRVVGSMISSGIENVAGQDADRLGRDRMTAGCC